MAVEQTLVLVKPDGVQRGLIGEIIKRFEQRGLKIVAMKMVDASENAEDHYTQSIAEKHGKHVRDYLLNYISICPVVALVIEGDNAIATIRKIAGSTYPGEADIGTIRGDFAHVSKEYVRKNNQGKNLVHSSENAEDAKREIAIWFTKEEIHSYKRSDEEHVI